MITKYFVGLLAVILAASFHDEVHILYSIIIGLGGLAVLIHATYDMITLHEYQ